MGVKYFAYFIYLILLFINGLIMSNIGLSFKSWQYWVIVVSFVAIYSCGYIRGGC